MANALIAEAKPKQPQSNIPDFGRQIALWADLVDTTDALLRAGFRLRFGPSVDVDAAYRSWYAAWADEHDLYLRQMAESLYRRGVRHGC